MSRRDGPVTQETPGLFRFPDARGSGSRKRWRSVTPLRRGKPDDGGPSPSSSCALGMTRGSGTLSRPARLETQGRWCWSRWISWPDWRPWHQGLGSISHDSTGYLRRTLGTDTGLFLTIQRAGWIALSRWRRCPGRNGSSGCSLLILRPVRADQHAHDASFTSGRRSGSASSPAAKPHFRHCLLCAKTASLAWLARATAFRRRFFVSDKIASSPSPALKNLP